MCKTRKKRYPNERIAKIRLVEIRTRRVLHGRTNRNEKRAYFCSRCRGWHLTSSD